MRMRRIWSIILVLAMLASFVPITASAATDPPTGDGYPTVNVKNWDELKAALEDRATPLSG